MSSPATYESSSRPTSLQVFSVVLPVFSILVTWNGCSCEMVPCWGFPGNAFPCWQVTLSTSFCVCSPLSYLSSFVKDLLKSVADTFSKIMIIKRATIISPITYVSHTMLSWHSCHWGCMSLHLKNKWDSAYLTWFSGDAISWNPAITQFENPCRLVERSPWIRRDSQHQLVSCECTILPVGPLAPFELP